MRIALGMSGGVDSTVAAELLKKQGHTVIGCTMQIWDGTPGANALPARFRRDRAIAHSQNPTSQPHAHSEPKRYGCYGSGETADLKHVAELAQKLKIEHHVVPLAPEYRRIVLDYFRREYRGGRTPNPCVICNRYVKFGLLPERLRAAGLEFDAFATGHYARIGRDPDSGLFALRRGADREKDQSYFLFHLNQRQLSQLLLPLGDMTKPEVIQLARQYGFPELAERHESQDFVDGANYGELFDETDARPGPIVDESGRVLGKHRGLIFYTIGQREGLGIAAGYRVYVKELRVDSNTMVVAVRNAVMSSSCMVKSVHWIAGMPPDNLLPAGDTGSIYAKPKTRPENLECQVRLRYRHAGTPAYLTLLDGNRAHVKFSAPQFAVTPGQAAVFYNDDNALGGGWIDQSVIRSEYDNIKNQQS